MPIPETPYTREEAYLNAIATGDSSGIPETPYTREEMYLDAIARNGGGGGGGGSSTLAGLTDVDISNPADGQTLVYNSTSGKWENGNGGGGGSYTVFVGIYTDDPITITLDTTFEDLYTACTNGPVWIRFTKGDGLTTTLLIVLYVVATVPGVGALYQFGDSSGFFAAGAASDTPVFQM